jgi:hypothetical protein
LSSPLVAELALSASVVAMFAEKRQWGTEYHELESVRNLGSVVSCLHNDVWA